MILSAGSSLRPRSAPTLRRIPSKSCGGSAQRWQVEVKFREVRDHLGVETQRQWA